ncbi:hypothetical protein DFS34DRAFT_616538 [Phlyctochytrium arcticum]|nr:hypothetical protein DFS34DRAFT_616538 [Phlyctochytrium arcticum]
MLEGTRRKSQNDHAPVHDEKKMSAFFRVSMPQARLAVLPQGMQIADRDQSNVSTQSIEHLTITSNNLKPLQNVVAYTSLWTLSLSGCRNLPLHHLDFISAFQALGLLDLSFTSIDFLTLQKSLRSVKILQLRCIGCPNLLLSEGPPERRGFAVFTLPEVWMLDGVVVTWDERKKWTDAVRGEGTSQHGLAVSTKQRLFDLMDREFVPFSTVFKATEKADDNNNGTRHKATEKGRIWSKWAKEYLEGIPAEFYMGVDRDMWRLHILSQDLERRVLKHLSSAINNPQIAKGILLSFITGGGHISQAPRRGHGTRNAPIEKDAVPSSQLILENDTSTIASRAILALLIFGSLSSDFPLDVLQRVLETVFILRWDAEARMRGDVDHWARPGASPLSWPVSLRLKYLALLTGRLTLDCISETSVHASTPPLLPPSQLAILREMQTLYLTSDCSKPVATRITSQFAKAPQLAQSPFAASLSSISRENPLATIPGTNPSVGKATTAEAVPIVPHHVVPVPQLNNLQQYDLAHVHLNILQLACLDSNARGFLKSCCSALVHTYNRGLRTLIGEDWLNSDRSALTPGRPDESGSVSLGFLQEWGIGESDVDRAQRRLDLEEEEVELPDGEDWFGNEDDGGNQEIHPTPILERSAAFLKSSKVPSGRTPTAKSSKLPAQYSSQSRPQSFKGTSSSSQRGSTSRKVASSQPKDVHHPTFRLSTQDRDAETMAMPLEALALELKYRICRGVEQAMDLISRNALDPTDALTDDKEVRGIHGLAAGRISKETVDCAEVQAALVEKRVYDRAAAYTKQKAASSVQI